MQILRRLMLACVAATFLTPILLHAYDNESQVLARHALEDKMKELDAQQSITSAPPPMVTQPTSTKAKKQKPAKVSKSANTATQAPATQKPAPQETLVTPSQPPQEVSPAQTAPSTAAAAQKPAAPAMAVSSQPTPVVSAPAATPVYSTAATSSADTEETEKLREAMRKQMMQEQHTKAAATNTPSQTSQPWNQPYPSHQEQHVARTSQHPKEPAPSLPPLPSPPTGLSASKQQKLDQLLQLYRADQITPQEYHEQRAKILAEP